MNEQITISARGTAECVGMASVYLEVGVGGFIDEETLTGKKRTRSMVK